MTLRSARLVKLAVILIILCNAFYWLTRSSIRPALPLILGGQISESVLGLLLSLQAVLPLVFALAAGSFGDRYGHTRVLNVGAACGVLAALGYLLGFTWLAGTGWSLLALAVATCLSGMTWLLIWLAVQSLATDTLKAEDGYVGPPVSRMIHWIALTMSFGTIGGPLLGGWLIDVVSLRDFWLIQAAASLVHAMLCLAMGKLNRAKTVPADCVEAPVARSFFNLGFRDYLGSWGQMGGRQYVAVLLGSLLLLFAADLAITFLPAKLAEAQLSPLAIGAIAVGGPASGAFMRLILALPWFELQPRVALIFSLGIGALGIISMGFLEPGYAWLFSSAMLGCGIGLGEPVGLQLLANASAQAKRGLALSGRVLANRIGMFLAPLIAYQAFALLGGFAGALLIFALFVAGTVSTAILLKRG